MGHRGAWYEGSADPLDAAVDVGPENQYEPDQEANPREVNRRTIAGHVEFAAHDPLEIMLECERQDEMLGLEKGETLKLFMESISHTH